MSARKKTASMKEKGWVACLPAAILDVAIAMNVVGIVEGGGEEEEKREMEEVEDNH